MASMRRSSFTVITETSITPRRAPEQGKKFAIPRGFGMARCGMLWYTYVKLRTPEGCTYEMPVLRLLREPRD